MALDSGFDDVGFDGSIDHASPLQRLKKSYGMHSVEINWFASYRDYRSQYVR